MKYSFQSILLPLVFLIFTSFINLSAQDLRFGFSFDIGLGNKIQELDDIEFTWLDEVYTAHPGDADLFLKMAGTANLDYLYGRSAFMLESGYGIYSTAWRYFNTIFEVDTIRLNVAKSAIPIYLKYGYLFGKSTYIQPFVGIGIAYHYNFSSFSEMLYPAELPLYYDEESLMSRLPEDMVRNSVDYLAVAGVEVIFPSALKLSLNYEYKLFSEFGTSFNHIGTFKITKTISLMNREKKRNAQLLKYIKYEK